MGFYTLKENEMLVIHVPKQIVTFQCINGNVCIVNNDKALEMSYYTLREYDEFLIETKNQTVNLIVNFGELKPFYRERNKDNNQVHKVYQVKQND